MSSIVQNDTSPIDFFMADNTDSSGDTGKSGLLAAGITFLIAKGGGNFVAGTGTIAAKTGASVGWWQYTPVAADVGTLGDIAFEATATGCFKWKDIRRVVQAGAAASDWTTARAAKIDHLDADISTIAGDIAALNDLDAAGVRAAVGLAAADLDTQLGALPSVADFLDAVIETNGGTTISVKEALQLAAALPGGTVAGILAGAGNQTITVKSASGQDFLSIAGDELGNRVVTRTPIV